VYTWGRRGGDGRVRFGPDAAAIAVHGAGATLLTRSVRTGTVVYFSAEPRFGLEAALSHAEGLGFLFDDEANLVGGSRQWPAWLAEIFPAEPAERAEREPSRPSAGPSQVPWSRAAGEHGHP